MNNSDLFDLSVLAIVIGFAVRGYMKGLIYQLGALIAIIIGVIVAFRFTPSLAPYLFGNDNIKSIAAFIILLNLATMVVWGFVNLLSRLVSNLKLNNWNYQMGALLGVVYGILCAMALTFVLLIYAVPESETIVDENEDRIEAPVSNGPSFIMQSRTGPFLTRIALVTIDHLPQGGDCRFYDYWREYFLENANAIKKNNPDLPPDPFQGGSSEEPASDDEKPQLPVSLPPLDSGL